MSLLSLQGLRKEFGNRLLFDLPQLTIEPGCAIVLTGMNGVGKSTFLRILAGLESANCNAVHFLDQAMSLTPYPAQMRKNIVYVHQQPQLFCGTLESNIAYGLKARGLPKSEQNILVEEALKWAGMEAARDLDPRLLSGGEKQRIALARAMVLKPKLLLLDEPTANLDGAARELVMAMIPQITERGQSLIMACHDRDLINLPNVQRWKLRDAKIEIK